jgi:hypothetical protein
MESPGDGSGKPLEETKLADGELGRSDATIESAMADLRALQRRSAELQFRCGAMAKELALAMRLLEMRTLWGPKSIGALIRNQEIHAIDATTSRYHIDRLEESADEVVIAGWFFDLDRQQSPNDSPAIALRLTDACWIAIPTARIERQDVAAHFGRSSDVSPDIRYCGFHASLPKGLWPNRAAEITLLTYRPGTIIARTPIIQQTLP